MKYFNFLRIILPVILFLLFNNDVFALPPGATMGNAINAGTLNPGITFTDTRNNSTSYGYGNDFGQASDDIFYKFTLGSATEVSISHCGSAIDTYMYLLNSAGSIIASNDDNGPMCTGMRASIKMQLAAGTYYVVSEGWSTNSGNITTAIISLPEGATLSNPINAGTLTAGVSFTDTRNNSPANGYGNNFGQASDDIYYRFTLSDSAEVSISHCGSPIDTYIYLLNSAGIIIASDDDNGPLCSALQASIKMQLAAGTYYIVSEGWSSNSGDITTSISIEDNNFYQQVNHIFANIDKSQITTGMLRDYGLDFLNLDNYSGTALTDSNFVGLSEWRMLYASLYSSQINGNAGLLYLDTVNKRINSYNYSNQPIAFTVLYYSYQSLRSDAVSANLMSVSNGQLYDVPGRSQSPYQNDDLFAAAPIRQAAFIGNNQIIFRPELFFSNSNKTVTAIAVDFGATGSYQNVGFNTPVTVNYPQEGFYPINIRITFNDGTIKYGHTKLVAYPNPAGSTQNYTLQAQSGIQTYSYTEGRTLTNKPVTATKAYQGQVAHGDVTIQLAENNTTGQIRKPLIVVEGFDPTNDYSFRSFITSISEDENTNPKQSITLNYGLDNTNDYDLIFVNWGNSTDYMQRNAYLLERVIDSINSVKTTYNGVRQQNVIIGMSMGGVITRYALRDMELNNVAHETRLFISHDAPQWGANVPVGIQAAVQHLYPFEIINLEGSFPWIRWKDMFPDMVNALDLFNSPAARQMLIQRYQLSGQNLIPENSLHDSFYNELNSMGWPLNCRNLTLSNGSDNGIPVFPDNSRMFEIPGDRGMNYLGSVWRSLVSTLLAPEIGVVTGPNSPSFNGWALMWQFPLSLFSTKSNVITDFRINAVPRNGTGELYRGDIYSKKKILGLFNVTNYFLKCHVNAPSGILPLDNAPGGVYNVSEYGLDASVIQSQLPDFLNATAQTLQPQFCFIPTVSSLAISNPAQNLFSDLSDNVNCTNPAQVQDYFAPEQNELHISYTQPSSDWILEVQDPSSACAKICPANLAISGPPSVCQSGTSFSVPNLPSGTSVQWSCSPNLTLFSGQGTASATFKSTGSGSAWIGATVSGSCQSDIVLPQKNNLTAGGLVTYPIAGPSTLCPTQNATYQAYTPGATYYHWTYSGLQVYGVDNGSSSIQLYAPPGFTGGYITVTASNACGTSYNTPALYVGKSTNCGSGYAYSFYPNPANTELTVSYSPENGTEAASFMQTKSDTGSKKQFTVKLLNGKGEVLKMGKSSGRNNITMSIAEITAGTYFLHIIDGKGIIKKQIIIKH